MPKTLKNWVKFKIEVETEEPFRVGATKDVFTDIDNPIVLLNNEPAIPATSLKGAWREEIERWLIATYYDEKTRKWKDPAMQPCIPAGKISDDERELLKQNKYKNRTWTDNQKQQHFEPEQCEYKKGARTYICPACYLLGAQGLNGFARVPFLFPVEGQKDLEKELYSLREDRAVGGAVKGSNRSWFIVQKGVKFEGTLEVLREDKIKAWTFGKPRGLAYGEGDKWLESNGWNAERITKDLIIDRLQSIELLGGFKSKGCGKVKITVQEIK